MSHSTFHPPGKGKGRDMAVKFILTEYVALAMAQAVYDSNSTVDEK
jgi:hypothetical protein